MSKRKNKYKRRRVTIIAVTLVVALLIIFKMTNGHSADNTGEANGSNIKGTSSGDKEILKDEKITGVTVSPESYTAFTGEKISTDKFNVTLSYESGKTKDINENISFSSDSPILKTEENNIIVSDDAVTAENGTIKVNYEGFSSEINIKIFNNLNDTIDGNSQVKNTSAYDIVANKKRNLPADYIPEDLVPLDGIPTSLKNPEVNQLRKVAYEALKELFLKAKEEKSFELYARSGYRSYKTQIDLYNSYVANHGQEAADKFSAKPGQSEHQTGLAMDITCASMNYQLDDTFFDKEEGKWVAENAHRFGFIIRYPKGKESVTGYQYEPWHLRYVGTALAKEIYEKQITLEEYFEQCMN